VWPLLIAALVFLFRARLRPALLIAIGALTVASFAYTLYYSVEQPDLAFFFSTTRIWELGVGALLAIGFPTLVRLPSVLRSVLGWCGLALIVFSILTLDATTVWPGTATLMPVLGTAAVILAGGGVGSRWGAERVLGLAPAVWIGGLSYSLYLWHWPFLVAAEGIWGDLRVRYGVVVVLASFIPAWLSYRYVENPLRRSPRLVLPRRSLLLGAAGMAVSAAAGLGLVASFSLVDTIPVASASQAPGARALTDPAYADVDWAKVDTVDRLRPSTLEAYGDTPDVGQEKCVVQKTEDAFRTCSFGDEDSDRTVVLVGDSKALQWFTPVRRIAEREGWQLVLVAKNGCAFADVIRLIGEHRNPSCDAWAPEALSTIKEMKPDVVLTVTRWGTSLPADGSTEADYDSKTMVDGIVRYWRDVISAGATLVPILDTPGPPGGDGPGCVQANLRHLTNCVYSKRGRMEESGAAAQLEAAAQVPEADVVDMSPVLCPDGRRCPPVIGNVLVYRSGTHISDTYASTSTDALAREFAKATGGLLGAG
jgi:hypothetical protein